MKKINGLALAVILMLTANALMAQSYSETALMFSRTRPTGSARVLGMGGAQVSLGGDFSSAYSNPAGLGMFNRSEFSISPGYFKLQNTGTYSSGSTILSEGNSDSRTGINIPAFGLIFSKPQNETGFVQGTFGITMTRVNDFNSNLSYRTDQPNPNTSLIDYFLQQASGDYPEQFLQNDPRTGQPGGLYNSVTEMAYNNYLIGEETIFDPNADPTAYFTDVDGTAMQDERIQTKGAQNQWNFSYGANFNDKFFLGAGLGLVSVNYTSVKTYTEQFQDQPLNYFTLNEDLQIRGTGINLTVGGIVRPVDGLQIGGSITTPTRYNLTDVYSASMRSGWNNFQYDDNTILNDESSATDVVTSIYTLNTPWKLSAGASYIFGKVGLISLDIENRNYGGANYSSRESGINYNTDNDEIKSNYASTINFRGGGEIRLSKFRVRAGGSFMPDPYKSEQNEVKRSWSSASLGAGYRAKSVYFDLAYIYSWAGKLGEENSGNSYRPYTVNNSNSPLLRYGQKLTNVVATLGFTF